MLNPKSYKLLATSDIKLIKVSSTNTNIVLLTNKMCLVPSIHEPNQPGNTMSKTAETVKILTAWRRRGVIKSVEKVKKCVIKL